MTTPVDVKNYLLAGLAGVLDDPLRQLGFTRRKGSLTYARTLNDAEQKITFVMDCFPKYQPSADAHIHPTLQLAIPKVNEMASALVKDDKMLLGGAPEIIVNQPIEFTAPKDRHERWFASGSEQFITSCEAIKSFLCQWTLPFLSEVSTPSDLVKLYESDDERMMKQRHWYVFVAAAYQMLGHFDKARDVVRRHFGSPSLRKKYAKLYTSLGVDV